MSELDSSLRRLASLPVPADLGSIDDAVLGALAAQRGEQAISKRATALAGAVALVLGLSSAGLATADAAQAQPFTLFAPDNPLAPSTLLDLHP